MPSDSTKTLVDLREEVSFRVGGVKNPRFLFPTKKAVDVCRSVVGAQTTTYVGVFPAVFFSVPFRVGTIT